MKKEIEEKKVEKKMKKMKEQEEEEEEEREKKRKGLTGTDEGLCFCDTIHSSFSSSHLHPCTIEFNSLRENGWFQI